MRTPQTLEEIKKSPKLNKRDFGVSDFLTTGEVEELHTAAATSHKKQPLFDPIDAFVAEIVARFGYDVYLKWSAGKIDHDWLTRMLNAERARDKQQLLSLEGIIYAMVSASMSKKPQKAVRQARDLMKRDIKIANGEG